MAKMQSKITARHMTSVPGEVLRKLRLRPGSIVEWVWLEDSGRFLFRPVGNQIGTDFRKATFPDDEPRTRRATKAAIRKYIRKKRPG